VAQTPNLKEESITMTTHREAASAPTVRAARQDPQALCLAVAALWVAAAVVYLGGSYGLDSSEFMRGVRPLVPDFHIALADVTFGGVRQASAAARLVLGAICVAGAIAAALAASRDTRRPHATATGAGMALFVATVVAAPDGRPAWLGLVLATVSIRAWLRQSTSAQLPSRLTDRVRGRASAP
jgi:hypothetical protein